MSYKQLRRIARAEQQRATHFSVSQVSEDGTDGRPSLAASDRAADASAVGPLLEVSGSLHKGDPVLIVESTLGLPQILGGSPWRTR